MRGLVLLTLVVAALAKPRWHELESYSFADYVRDFARRYSTEEAELRETIFNENLAAIKKHNSGSFTWKQGVNQFTDLTSAEFKKYLGYNKAMSRAYRAANPEKLAAPEAKYDTASLPHTVDWRNQGVVTAVKDQMACGSCWAFASTETIESHVALATGQLMVLSPQQLVSCMPNPNECGGNGGCGGAIAELAFDFIKQNGMTTEWSYSYTSGYGDSGKCKFNKTVTQPVVTVGGFEKLPNNSYDALMTAVANQGPIAISVQANVWQHYEGGVFAGCSNLSDIDLDHAVQLVGYGTDPKDGDYWLVRNSWNTVWGEAGYIKLARSSTPKCGTDPTPADGDACKGDNAPQHVCGECGILFDTAYPTGAKLL